MKHLTVRNLPDSVAKAIDREKKRRGLSLNQTIVQLLSQSLGVAPHTPRRNGLAKLAGSWTAEEHRQFETHIRATEQIDPELWQ